MPKKKPDRTGSIAGAATRTIQASTFKATCLELMDEVEAQRTEFVVTKHGRPVVRVGPVDRTPPSPFGFLRNTVVSQADIVSPEPDAWRMSEADPIGADTR